MNNSPGSVRVESVAVVEGRLCPEPCCNWLKKLKASIRSWHTRGSGPCKKQGKKRRIVNKSSCQMKVREQQKWRHKRWDMEVEHGGRRWGQWGRWLDSQQLSSTMRFYAPSNSVARRPLDFMYTLIHSWELPVLQFPPFANQFHFLYAGTFLVYGSYGGKVRLKGRVPLFPLSYKDPDSLQV